MASRLDAACGVGRVSRSDHGAAGAGWLLVALLSLSVSCSTGPDPAAVPVAVPVAVPGARRAAPAPQRTFAQLIYVPGVDHVARIADGVYRGAQPDGVEGYRALKDQGITTVINLRQFHDSREEAEAAGLAYVSLPVQASVLGSEPPSEAQVRRFFEIVNDPAQRPVYFHCMTGKDRTGTLCALYRMEQDGWSNEDAEAELHAFGYHTVYDDLVEFVREYQPRGYGQNDR